MNTNVSNKYKKIELKYSYSSEYFECVKPMLELNFKQFQK